MWSRLKEKLSEIQAQRDSVNEDDIREAREKCDDEGAKGFRSDVELLVDMAEDIMHGRFKVSPEVIAAIAAAILYFVWALDLVPDFIPVLGYIDDGLVIAATIKACMTDIQRYKKWRKDKEWTQDNPLGRLMKKAKTYLQARRSLPRKDYIIY